MIHRRSRPITRRQQEILDYINSCRGSAPTIRQIARHFGFLRHAAFCHIVALRRKGAIPENNRESRKFTPIPIKMARELRDKDYVLMEAKGGFFAGAGINDGDWVVLRRKPAKGDIVAVSDDCNPVLMRFAPTRLHGRLDQLGGKMKATVLRDGVKLKVLGAIVSVIRKPP